MTGNILFLIIQIYVKISKWIYNEGMFDNKKTKFLFANIIKVSLVSIVMIKVEIAASMDI